MKTALALLLFLPGLAHADPLPTATEIFHLRTECGLLAKRLFEEHKRSYPLNRFAYKSVYNSKLNSCYYLQITNFYDQTGKLISSIQELYDAQNPGDISSSGDPIAIANSKDGAKSFAPDHNNKLEPATFDWAAFYIDTLVNHADE